jgi:hypothetical protein
VKVIWNLKNQSPPKKVLKNMKIELEQMLKTWEGPQGDDVRKGGPFGKGFSEGYMAILKELLG